MSNIFFVPVGPVGQQQLVVNGTVLKSSSVTVAQHSGRSFASIRDPVEGKILTENTFSVISKHFFNIEIEQDFPWTNLQSSALITFESGSSSAELALILRIDVTNWAGPYSVGELAEGIRNALSESDMQGLTWGYFRGDAVELRCSIRDLEHRVCDEIQHWAEAIRPHYEQVQAILTQVIERDTLVTLFDFPPAVRTACEQYLLYFAQFLRDLGIEAQADIRHRAGQVLFSVKPEHGAEALDRIREALDAYLDLPCALGFDASAGEYPDIAVLQLQANVHHLKGQLTIASAVLRARDAEIEALQLSNYQHRQMRATQVEVDHLAALPPPRRDSEREVEPAREEPIFGGLMTITPYEGKGFTVALPELLRRLKRKFSKDQDRE